MPRKRAISDAVRAARPRSRTRTGATSRPPTTETPPKTRTAPAPTAGAATAPIPAAPLQPPPLAPEIAAELRRAGVEGAAAGAAALGASAVAGVLLEIAALLEFTDENVFKVRAYENAARALAGLGEDLERLLSEDRLQDVRGIGASIAAKVAMLARTGTLPYYEELKARVPSGLLDMLRIPGLGPKKIKALHDELGIESIAELEVACREGRLEGQRGFGAKTAENILDGIARLRRVQGRFLWHFAHEQAAPILAAIEHHPSVARAEIAGSLRRHKETVGDVDILVASRDPEAVMNLFGSGPWVARVLGSGATKTSIVHVSNIQMDLRAVTETQYPYALHHFTGSKEHNVAMRARAQRLGFKMNEYGLWHDEELVACGDEGEIFAALGLAFIPPELREDMGEIECAASGGLPCHLLELGDLRGAFHVHTLDSDGRATLADMVQAARGLGWQFVGISDHSRSVVYAHGLEPRRVAEQRRRIDRLGARARGIRVLHGTECDILPDGRLDYDEETLRGLDFVIASVHSAFKLDRDEQTRRVLRAVENPCTTILAHPTGRILLAREGYDIDLPAVLEAAARCGVVAEINAHPQRLDLDGAAAKMARDKGVTLAIGPDAHAVDGLGAVKYGVAIARRGWLEPRHVLNAWKLEEVEAHLQRRRERWSAPRP